MVVRGLQIISSFPVRNQFDFAGRTIRQTERKAAKRPAKRSEEYRKVYDYAFMRKTP